MPNTKNYREQGGDKWVIGGEQTIENDGKFKVKSGGEADIESGGELKIDGTAIASTAAEINALYEAGAAKADFEKLAALTASANQLNTLADNIEALAAFVSAGLGVVESVEQADHATTPVEVVGAEEVGNRACLIAAICTTTVAGDTKPTFNLGEADGGADKFIAAAILEDATAGDVFISAGVLTDNKAMQMAVTEGDAGEGGAEPAGAFDVLVLLLPVSNV